MTLVVVVVVVVVVLRRSASHRMALHIIIFTTEGKYIKGYTAHKKERKIERERDEEEKKLMLYFKLPLKTIAH